MAFQLLSHNLEMSQLRNQEIRVTQGGFYVSSGLLALIFVYYDIHFFIQFRKQIL